MNHAMRSLTLVAFLATAHVLILCVDSARGADSLITNGDFQKWTEGLPDGWKVEIGAMNGAESPKSDVKPIKGPALMLRGDASTMAWHSVSQKFPARSGESYALEFESRGKGIKREGRQHNNCYVGLMSLDEGGKPIAPKIEDLTGDADWTKHRITVAVPANAASTQVVIFLSKTGVVGIRNVSVTKAKPSDLLKSLLANGAFSDWTDGKPNDWTVEIGAKNGADEPASKVVKVDDPGLSLRGTASTMAWHSVSQSLSLPAGKSYRLGFQSQSEGVQRQGRQHNNCYVGVMIFDAEGQRVGASIEDLSRNSVWRRHQLDFKVPPNGAKTQVIIFLSKTGALTVKNLLLSETNGSDSR